MSQLDELLVKYSKDLNEKCKVKSNETLLRKVAKGLGPSIYDKDSATVAASSQKELDTVKNNFLIKKLGLSDSDELIDVINKAIDTYGCSHPNKYRVVIYYLLVVHFNKESVYT